MDFCILPPHVHQLRYAKLSASQFCLAHIEDPEYWKFYEERKKRGDWVILDNGAYEGNADWTKLRNRIVTLKPNVVVLPDYLAQSWEKTFFEARMFLDDNYKQFPYVEWMFVPQAEKGDIVGWSTCLNHALGDTRIKWIGLPRALGYYYTEDKYIRPRIAKFLKRQRPDILIHALGMMEGNIGELYALADTHCVESIDSHWPFKGYEHEILPRLEACGVDTNVDIRKRSNPQR